MFGKVVLACQHQRKQLSIPVETCMLIAPIRPNIISDSPSWLVDNVAAHPERRALRLISVWYSLLYFSFPLSLSHSLFLTHYLYFSHNLTFPKFYAQRVTSTFPPVSERCIIILALLDLSYSGPSFIMTS